MLKMQPCDVSSRYPDKEKEIFFDGGDRRKMVPVAVGWHLISCQLCAMSKAPTKWRAQLGSVELCSN